MAFIAKQDISLINWNNFKGSYGKEILDHLGIPQRAQWYLPQLMAFLASTMKLKRNSTGKFSFRESLIQTGQLCDLGEIKFQDGTPITKQTFQKILAFLAHYPRSEILPKGLTQSSLQGSRWAAGVPLVLSAFKEFRDIKYGDWDWQEEDIFIKYFAGVDFLMKPAAAAEKEPGELPRLREASLVDLIRQAWVPPWTPEELCRLCEAARPYKSGAKAGQLRTYAQMTSLTATDLDLEFDKLGPVGWFKPMLCQTWVFQPHVISRFAINNVQDLDNHVPSIRGDLEILTTKQYVVSDDLEDIWG